MHTIEATAAKTGFGNAPSQSSTWKDWLGITASIGCAIHCAAMPFVVAYLPALGLSFLADESFHKWMALACFLIAIVAFLPGLRKHRNFVPISIAAVGLAIITFAAFGLSDQCCAACASPTSAAAACVDCDCCTSEHDGQLEAAEVAAVAVGEEGSPWLAWIAPWVTPLGGVLLVSAHLLNRQCGCRCGCCEVDAEIEGVA